MKRAYETHGTFESYPRSFVEDHVTLAQLECALRSFDRYRRLKWFETDADINRVNDALGQAALLVNEAARFLPKRTSGLDHRVAAWRGYWLALGDQEYKMIKFLGDHDEVDLNEFTQAVWDSKPKTRTKVDTGISRLNKILLENDIPYTIVQKKGRLQVQLPKNNTPERAPSA
jgi:hypothetical protein